METELAKLKNEIAENKRKIKELEKQQKKYIVPKREIEKCKKYYMDTICSPYYRYLRFIEDVERCGWGQPPDEEINVWFGESKKDELDLEKARQFVCAIKPTWNEYFLESIKNIQKEDEDEDA